MSKNKKASNLRLMAGYYKKYQKVFWLDLLFAVLSGVIALIIPMVIRYVTTSLVYETKEVILSQVGFIAALLIILLVMDYYFKWYISSIGHIMGAEIEFDMRAEIFAHFQKLSFSFYDNQKIGRLMSRITTDLFDITELMHHGPENVILCTVKIVGGLVILFGINYRLGFAALVVLPFMLTFAYVMNRRMRRAFRRNREKVAIINGQIEDNLAGIRVVKSFANEEEENRKFDIGNQAFLASKRDSYHYMGVFHAGVGSFTMLMQLSVIVVGVILIALGHVTSDDLITFVLYISVLTEPIRTFVDFTEQFQNGYTGFERFREIMNIEPEVQDAPDAIELSDVNGEIEFCDVSFSYADAKEEVLSNINLKIPAGAYYALVGSSGAGKTTLCSLIPRFYNVTDGKILIDGKDIAHVTQKSLREQIGIVQQDVYLFAGTVYENILYGRADATKEEVIEAAKNANAHDFIMGLPNGYDTDIGQRGVKLSGGQKQRLSIARVFLKNPPILIFDEATSALDNESERVVKESMERLAKDRTTLVIAHRLSTIRNAENIIVLSENGVEEEGTHEQLLKSGGIYEGLYNMQFEE